MSQNYYKLYLESVLELAETLVIKSEYTALRINDYISNFHGAQHVDQNDPTTWKYYLNVSGEYHPLDPQITVVSLDTLQTIVFSKANLAVHKATAEAYQYNSRYYRELLLRYPEQEQLILGILYPVDIHKAIAAPDFSVLSYAPYLIEENEISLVDNINHWLYLFDVRWNNKQFTITDDWYGTSVLGVMYLQLVPLILNLRLRACKTSEAHSFHVREYLASHGMLDVYLSKMTRKQALFFYRNINYINRNAGKQDTFYWLVEKVMTDRNIPLSEYTMHHNADGMPGALTPDIYFRKELLEQSKTTYAQANMAYQTPAVLKKEYPLAPGNAAYSQENLNSIDGLFKRSLSSTLQTKLLESSMLDYSDAVPHTLHQVFINQWIAFTNTGRFNSTYVRVRSPRTGKELLMNTKDAYIYFLYAFAKTSGVTLQNIPPLFAMRVQREPTPSEDDLLSVVNEEIVTRSYATFIRSLHTEVTAIQTLDDFQQLCKKMHRSAMEQLYFVYQQEEVTKRGMVYNMVHRLYEDVWYQSPDAVSPYTTWLVFKGLEYEGLTLSDWDKIYKDIYEQVTGIDASSTENVVGIQKAMVALLTQLSSYSIQIASDINQYAIKAPNWNTVRVEQISKTARSYQAILLGIFKIFKREIRPRDYQLIRLENLLRNFIIENPPLDGGFIDVPIDIKPNDKEPRDFGVIDLGIFRLNQNTLPLPETVTSLETHPNFAAYYSMTAAQKALIRNIYCECPKAYFYPTQADLEDLILYTGLPGFNYQPIYQRHLNIAEYYYLPKSSFNFAVNGEIVELDAFHSNLGPEWLDNFNLNIGHEKLENFKLFDGIPGENDLPNFKYSGGWEYLEVFSPLKKGDEEHTLDGFEAHYHSLEMPTMEIVSISNATLNAFTHGTHTAELEAFQVIYYNSELDLGKFQSQTNELNGFQSAFHTANFSFRPMFTALTMGDMKYTVIQSLEFTTDLSIISGEYALSSFESNHVSYELNELVGWSGYTTELAGFTMNMDPEEIMDVDMKFINIHGATLPNIRSITGYREIRQLSASYSSITTRTFNWFDSLPEHEMIDPTYVDGQGILWQ